MCSVTGSSKQPMGYHLCDKLYIVCVFSDRYTLYVLCDKRKQCMCYITGILSVHVQ